MIARIRKALQRALAALMAFALCLTSSAYAEQLASAPLSTGATRDGMVRVYLSSLGNPSSITLTTAGSYSVNGNLNSALASGERVTVGFSSSSGRLTLTRGGVTTDMGSYFALRRHSADGANGILISQARKSANPYPGDISFRSVRQSSGSYKLYTVAHLYIENYLYGVLPYEMGNSAPIEALKSQAVAARTYTLRMMLARASGYYDVADTTADQVYNGTPSGYANCTQAVDATKGIVIMNGSSYTMTYYSASNGGQTESTKNIWGSNYDYLIVQDDPYDLANPDSVVKSATVSKNAAGQSGALMTLLKSKAASALGVSEGNITLETVDAITPHTPKYGYPSRLFTQMDFTLTVRAVNAYGMTQSSTVTVTCGIFTELESRLGMSIQSGSNELWSVADNGSSFKIQARRYGHAVGLSQRGAMYMGKLGYSYAQILAFYYPGCKRVRQSFTKTILSAVSSDTETTVEDAAELPEGETNGATGIVTVSGALALRASASENSAMIGAIAKGAPVSVLSSDGSWCFVRYGQLQGYVKASGLSVSGVPEASTTETPSSIAGFATVKCSGYLNLRAAGSSTANVKTTAPSGAVVTVISQSGDWAYIQYGVTAAYANTNYLVFSQSYPSGDVSEPTQTAQAAGDTAVVTTASGSLNLRSQAKAGSGILTRIPQGATVGVSSRGETWTGVSYGGLSGYVMTEFLTFVQATVTEAPAPTETPAPSEAPTETPTPEETLSPTQAPAQSELYAIVNTSSGSLNLRLEPSAQAAVIARIPKGAKVMIYHQDGDWCITEYGGEMGYVMTSFLSFDLTDQPTAAPSEAPTQAPSQALTAYVSTASGSLNLRESASGSAAVLTTIPRLAEVSVQEKGATWCFVSYHNVSGYVMTKFLAFGTPTATVAATQSASATTAPTQAPAITLDPTLSALDTPVTATVISDGALGLYAECSERAALTILIPVGAQVSVKKLGVVWCQISYDNYTGYCLTDGLNMNEV